MKTAIVHHWMTNMGGAERVLLEIHKLYPEADIYTSVYDPHAMPAFEGVDIKTTWLQKMPLRGKHQFWAPLRPLAFRMLNLKEYDLVISNDSSEAKNVRVRPDAVHISNNNTPIRYYWSHYHEYKADPGFGILNPLIRLVMPVFIWRLKKTDYKAAQRVDFFISNSSEIKRRVRKYYHRNSVVINPSVDVDRFLTAKKTKRNGYLIAGRQTTYKRFDLAVQACNELGLPLTVAGNGTEHEKLKEMAGPTITFKENVSDTEMVKLFHTHEAFIFPTEEDFGITPIEAMAAGMPVIAYEKGGVVDWMKPGVTGETFPEQTVESLTNVLKKFDPKDYKRKDLEGNAKRFSNERFQLELKEFVDSVTKDIR
jgi:glycosyltransferase involved in cell wall biosynthesis